MCLSHRAYTLSCPCSTHFSKSAFWRKMFSMFLSVCCGSIVRPFFSTWITSLILLFPFYLSVFFVLSCFTNSQFSWVLPSIHFILSSLFTFGCKNNVMIASTLGNFSPNSLPLCDPNCSSIGYLFFPNSLY